MSDLNKRRTIAVLALAAAVLGVGQAYAQDLPSKLVGTEWLAANLGKIDIRIIDMRMEIRDYWTSHLPSAVYLNPEALRWPENGVPLKLLSLKSLAELLGRMGIGPETPVVLYSEKNGFMPLFLLWALDYIGHKNCGVLEGGFDKWKGEGRFLTPDFPSRIKPTTYPVPTRLRAEVRATVEEVSAALGGKAVLIDTRAVEVFSGERGAWKRRGHIPGAVSLFWSENLKSDSSWKSKQELGEMYSALGVTADKKIIVYCGTGQMSSHTYFALKYILGFPSVRNFDGGFNEWSADPKRPVDSGRK